jgi:hypothetical protein
MGKSLGLSARRSITLFLVAVQTDRPPQLAEKAGQDAQGILVASLPS